ncbi:hypothetical protein [Roseofilum sp. Guam]|uniref:hypothetical protein n=1 Tax=Roseofilum sp. Guam TaxID=2821502 RepID=UPI001B240CED|nr:hypothetical protein [Roseofilum sp. Guam]MBP0031305.1 hypothetical protein [Roseofilum sp. Guam]
MNVIQYNPGGVTGAFIGVINNIGLPNNFNNAGFLQLCRVRNEGEVVDNLDVLNNLLGWNDNPIEQFKRESFNLNQQTGWFIDHLNQPPYLRPEDYDTFIQITTLPLGNEPQLPHFNCLAVYSTNGQLVENNGAVRVANNQLQRPMLIDRPANHDVGIILEFMVILVYRINQQGFLHNDRFYWSWNIATGANFRGFELPFLQGLNNNQLNQMVNVLQ